MNGVLDLGVQVVVFIQNLGGWLLKPMEVFSLIGSPYIFLVVGPFLYWCVSTEAGLRLGLLLMFSEGLNDIFKVAFHAPRPYWYSTDVKALSAESTFGLPSGHAQRAVVMWSGLAAWLKRGWVWAAAITLILLVGVSRLYLGVHFPTDTLLGWLIGAGLVWGLLRVERRLVGWFQRQALSAQILLSFLGSLTVLGLGLAVRLALRDWQMPSVWLVNAARAGGKPPAPLDPSGLISSTGTFFGMAAGAVFLRRRGGYAAAKGDGGQKAARYLVGLLGLLLLWYGLGIIFPQRADFPSYFLLYVQYTLIGIWFIGLAPETFVRMRLAERK